MDIVRRKPSAPARRAPQDMVRPPDPMPAPPAKKEELYISQKEIAETSRAEKLCRRGRLIRKAFRYFLLAFLLLLVSLGVFFAWKTYAVSKKIAAEPAKEASFSGDMRSMLSSLVPNESHEPLRGEKDGRINILLLGAAGEKKPGKNLTDTVMIMSVDTKAKKLAMLSLPRDLYVKIPGSSSYTKLNGLYQIGLKEGAGASLVKEAVGDITGLPIHYYLVADFEGFEKLVDDIGGINVTVERDIYDPRYPGPNYSYETFELKKGFHSLDGKTALKYVRERHDDPEGDFGRAKRQQQVIQAVKNKMFSARTLLNVFALSRMLDTLGDNIRTDIAFDELEGFLSLAKKADTENISNVVVDAWKSDSLLKVSHVQVGSVRAFILVPRVGNWSEIRELAQDIFSQDEIKRRRALIAEEDAKIAIIDRSGNALLAGKVRALLAEKLGMENVSVVQGRSGEEEIRTSVFDNADSRKIFTLDELVKKLPATLSAEDPVGGTDDADMIVTLGSDLAETYKYEEDSIDDYTKAQEEQEDFEFPLEG